MSEEIKEINRIIQSISDFYKMDNALKYYLDRRKANILLDYITSLQQKVEQLEKENQKFFEELNTCMIERNSFLDKVEQLEKENKILKDTILKALEFINNHTYRWKDTQFGEMVEVEDFEPGLKPIELINILKNKFENK